MAIDKLNSRKYRTHKERVFARDGRICRYCGSDENLQVDHIIPRKAGGTHDLENLQVLCRNCNLRKSISIGAGQNGVSNLMKSSFRYV